MIEQLFLSASNNKSYLLDVPNLDISTGPWLFYSIDWSELFSQLESDKNSQFLDFLNSHIFPQLNSRDDQGRYYNVLWRGVCCNCDNQQFIEELDEIYPFIMLNEEPVFLAKKYLIQCSEMSFLWLVQKYPQLWDFLDEYRASAYKSYDTKPSTDIYSSMINRDNFTGLKYWCERCFAKHPKSVEDELVELIYCISCRGDISVAQYQALDWCLEPWSQIQKPKQFIGSLLWKYLAEHRPHIFHAADILNISNILAHSNTENEFWSTAQVFIEQGKTTILQPFEDDYFYFPIKTVANLATAESLLEGRDPRYYIKIWTSAVKFFNDQDIQATIDFLYRHLSIIRKACETDNYYFINLVIKIGNSKPKIAIQIMHDLELGFSNDVEFVELAKLSLLRLYVEQKGQKFSGYDVLCNIVQRLIVLSKSRENIPTMSWFIYATDWSVSQHSPQEAQFLLEYTQDLKPSIPWSGCEQNFLQFLSAIFSNNYDCVLYLLDHISVSIDYKYLALDKIVKTIHTQEEIQKLLCIVCHPMVSNGHFNLLNYILYTETSNNLEFHRLFEMYLRHSELRRGILQNIGSIIRQHNIHKEWILESVVRNLGTECDPVFLLQGYITNNIWHWYFDNVREILQETVDLLCGNQLFAIILPDLALIVGEREPDKNFTQIHPIVQIRYMDRWARGDRDGSDQCTTKQRVNNDELIELAKREYEKRNDRRKSARSVRYN